MRRGKQPKDKPWPPFAAIEVEGGARVVEVALGALLCSGVHRCGECAGRGYQVEVQHMVGL